MRLQLKAWQQGGCLVEVMICLLMLTTPILGITALKLTQAKIISQQSQHTSAWALMEYKLNELRNLTDSAVEFNNLSSNLGGYLEAGDVQYDQYKFNLTWQVQLVTIQSTAKPLKQVVVNINWPGEGSSSQIITTTTVLNQDVVVR